MPTRLSPIDAATHLSSRTATLSETLPPAQGSTPATGAEPTLSATVERVLGSRSSQPAALENKSRSAIGVLAVAAVLALLYLGRAILMPITLAVVLGFALAPLIRLLRKARLGHATSILVAVSALAAGLLAIAAIVALQTLQMAENAALYEAEFKAKTAVLQNFSRTDASPAWKTVQRLLGWAGALAADAAYAPASPASSGVVPVVIREPAPSPVALAQRLLLLLWGPLGSAGVVVLVLIFVLLEREALRDRFIRLAGGADLRATTTAINDAGERLSRYLLRQFLVNIGVGAVLWAALTSIGLPHATLWAALAAGLRFVPYLGMPLTAVLAATFGLAVEPGWGLAAATLGSFVAIQTITSQVVEPRLYGHATGLSPLSIVLATVFWGWLWGPVGVVIATPLTLCLAVAGRHVASLGFLEIVLGDGPALTMPQRFYQRALSGDSEEIIDAALDFLKRKSFAAYCDAVLMPALALGRIDLAAGVIAPTQQQALRAAVVRVVEVLGNTARRRPAKPARQTVLDNPSPGRLLRVQRLQRQQPLGSSSGAAGSVTRIVLCVGLAAIGDDLATELLVRILRDLRVDARHLTLADLQEPPPGLDLSTIAAACIVSVDPGREQEVVVQVARDMRERLPGRAILALLMRDLLDVSDRLASGDAIDRVVTTLQDAAVEIAERAAPPLEASRLPQTAPAATSR